MKEFHPLEVFEFAVARGVDEIPAFAWWVGYTSKKSDTIIALARQQIAKTTHKYGIKIPTSWKHTIKINTNNGNRLWQDALMKQMKNVGVAFDALDNHQNVHVG